MEHAVHFKWSNGKEIKRFSLDLRDVDEPYDYLIAKLADEKLTSGEENLYWIDSDQDRILLFDSDSLKEAILMCPNLVLLQSGIRNEKEQPRTERVQRSRASSKISCRGRSRSSSRGRSRRYSPQRYQVYSEYPHLPLAPLSHHLQPSYFCSACNSCCPSRRGSSQDLTKCGRYCPQCTPHMCPYIKGLPCSSATFPEGYQHLGFKMQ
ncbi:hypothetical protein AB6A40_008386 [Gnathostoma spinigerum]|uniref:PB1 domain-containing protein n=1 Tax=Gnathostoma spinigerum TaxID=75299 RepID=A0ABD6EYA3_9BILA